MNQVPIEQLRVMLKGYPGDWREDTDQSNGLPAPPIHKAVPDTAMRIALPTPEELDFGSLPLSDAVTGRRSRRSFSTEPVTLDELGFLAWCAQGVTEIARNEEGEATQAFRTVPSGGARYPLETYLLVNRVDGVAPGVYRYLSFKHELVAIRLTEDLPAAARRACYDQAFVGEAAVVFVWAAVPYRTEWKYGFISHRMIAMEAGHACQNLYLAAEAIGAGACAMLGYDQSSMDELIGVDGQEEFTIYLACIGKQAGDDE